MASEHPRVRAENLCGYPDGLVEELGGLLAGCKVMASGPSRRAELGDIAIRHDPYRDGFYELETPTRTSYVAVFPTTGRVFFLGTWLKEVTTAVSPEELRLGRVAS